MGVVRVVLERSGIDCGVFRRILARLFPWALGRARLGLPAFAFKKIEHRWSSETMSSARGAQNLTVYKYIRDLLNGCHYLCCVNIVRFDVCDVLLAIPSLNRQTSCLFTLKMFLFPHL